MLLTVTSLCQPVSTNVDSNITWLYSTAIIDTAVKNRLAPGSQEVEKYKGLIRNVSV